ncbi:unnamed protein product, partial [Lymnaea stagnalis]
MVDRNGQLDLLLVGNTGMGKRTIGNTILSRDAFQSDSGFTSVTKRIQFEYSDYNGRIIKVVVSPGVGDTDLSQEEGLAQIADSMKQAVAVNPEGYHAFLLVFEFGQDFTREDENTLKILRSFFGEEFVSEYCIVVITHGQLYKPKKHGDAPFSDWMTSQSGQMKALIEEVNGRVILFDDVLKDEDKMKEQVDEIIKMVDQISVRRIRYTNELFKMARHERERMLVDTKTPFIQEESIIEASLILQQLAQVQMRDPEQQLKRLDALKARADALLSKVKEQDKFTGVLQNIILSSRDIVECVEDQMLATKEAIRQKGIKKDEQKLLKDLRAQRIRYLENNNDDLKARIRELQKKGNERNALSELTVNGLKSKVKQVEDAYNE